MEYKELVEDLKSKLEKNSSNYYYDGDLYYFDKPILLHKIYKRRSFDDIWRHYKNISSKNTKKRVLKAMLECNLRANYCNTTGLIVFFVFKSKLPYNYKFFHTVQSYLNSMNCAEKSTEKLIKLYDSIQ